MFLYEFTILLKVNLSSKNKLIIIYVSVESDKVSKFLFRWINSDLQFESINRIAFFLFIVVLLFCLNVVC